jgi:hypothetical protein
LPDYGRFAVLTGGISVDFWLRPMACGIVADQQMRKPEAPLDPANRCISLIVQYIVKNRDEDEDTKSPSESNKTNDGNKPAAPAEKPSVKD